MDLLRYNIRLPEEIINLIIEFHPLDHHENIRRCLDELITCKLYVIFAGNINHLSFVGSKGLIFDGLKLYTYKETIKNMCGVLLLNSIRCGNCLKTSCGCLNNITGKRLNMKWEVSRRELFNMSKIAFNGHLGRFVILDTILIQSGQLAIVG